MALPYLVEQDTREKVFCDIKILMKRRTLNASFHSSKSIVPPLLFTIFAYKYWFACDQ